MPTINGASISIRPLKEWHEYLAAEELQRIVWQMPDWRDVVPANLLIAAHKNGGIALGAFDANDRLTGFAFSFLGTAEQSGKRILKHCSHMLAVLPAYQGQKIGARLKFKQRELVLAQDIALMTWTYDPLLALNANLNLARLGAIARHYIVNAYGDMTDALNAGLPSDRFEVEWWLNSPRVIECIAHPERNAVESKGAQSAERQPKGESKDALPRDWHTLVQAGAQGVLRIEFDARGLPRIARVNEPRGDPLLAEIPADLNAIRAAAPDLALDWRLRTRDLFQRVFAGGYVATDFVFATRGGHSRAAYILTREPIDFGTT